MGKQLLLFVRRGSIFVQRGNGPRLFPPPSLGVSSLDLGRRHVRRPFFCVAALAACVLLGGRAIGPQFLERDASQRVG